MLPKGHRHRSVRAEYVAMRGVEAVSAPVIPIVDLDLYERGNAEAEIGSAGPGKSAAQAGGPASHTISAPPEAAGLRLDQYLAQAIPDISRSRVQLLIDHGQVLVNGSVAKPKHRVRRSSSRADRSRRRSMRRPRIFRLRSSSKTSFWRS